MKLLVAMTVGGIIGMERERKKRGAGFRTYMLVAIGASLTKEKHGDISQVNAVFSVHMPKRQPHSEVLAALSTVDGIISIEEI